MAPGGRPRRGLHARQRDLRRRPPRPARRPRHRHRVPRAGRLRRVVPADPHERPADAQRRVVAGRGRDRGRPARPPPRVGHLHDDARRVPRLRGPAAAAVVAHRGRRLRRRRGVHHGRVRAVGAPRRRLLEPGGAGLGRRRRRRRGVRRLDRPGHDAVRARRPGVGGRHRRGGAVVLGLSIACFLKGRILLGVVGLFVPLAGLFGALRLGRPTSPWGRRRYAGPRLARAQARFAADTRAARWQRRLGDLVAGAPTGGDGDG
jgi:hypothetical protein